MQVWRWLFDIPGMKICDVSSLSDQDIRWFDDWEDLSAALGEAGSSQGAWSPEFGAAPWAETISFNAETRRRAKANGRMVLRSPALINIHLNGMQGACLANARVSCWNEAGARARSMYSQEILDSVQWKALASVSGRIVRQLKREAPACLGSCPIMPDALARFVSGELKLWNWGSVCEYPSDLVTPN